MRRARSLLAASLLLGAMLAVFAATAFALKPSTQPTSVGVAQREFHITPYRRSVPVGAVKLNIRNYGEDVHNLVVRGPKGFTAIGPDVDSGSGATWTVKLRRPGTYSLLCTRANHLKLGMKAKLKVVKPAKKK
jgi:plastocyanin